MTDYDFLLWLQQWFDQNPQAKTISEEQTVILSEKLEEAMVESVHGELNGFGNATPQEGPFEEYPTEPYMTANHFCIWLKGYLDISFDKEIPPQPTNAIKQKLAKFDIGNKL